MLFEGGYTFTNFLVNAFVIFLFIVWIWLLISIFSDLFRRRDLSGGAKVLWLIFVLVLPYIGVLAYLLTQGAGMNQRSVDSAKEAREEIRNAIGFSVADELKKLDELKASGSITADEYSKLRARIV